MLPGSVGSASGLIGVYGGPLGTNRLPLPGFALGAIVGCVAVAKDVGSRGEARGNRRSFPWKTSQSCVDLRASRAMEQWTEAHGAV